MLEKKSKDWKNNRQFTYKNKSYKKKNYISKKKR